MLLLGAATTLLFDKNRTSLYEVECLNNFVLGSKVGAPRWSSLALQVSTSGVRAVDQHPVPEQKLSTYDSLVTAS